MFDASTGLWSWLFAFLGLLAVLVRETRLARKDGMTLAGADNADDPLFHNLFGDSNDRSGGPSKG